MYGIGIFELFLIFLVLLLFMNPSEIFEVIRKLGVWYRKIRALEDELRIDKEVFGFDTDEGDKEGDNP